MHTHNCGYSLPAKFIRSTPYKYMLEVEEYVLSHKRICFKEDMLYMLEVEA